jgi:hypothetical protein
MITVIKSGSSELLNLNGFSTKRLNIILHSIRWPVEFLIDFIEKIFLEFFKIILIDTVLGDRIKSKQRRLSKYIFKVCKLFLKKSILSSQSSILLTNLFLNLLHFHNFNFKLILMILLSQSASNCAFSVLHTSINS